MPDHTIGTPIAKLLIGERVLQLVANKYASNSRLALQLRTLDNQPVASVSVNFDNTPILYPYIAVKSYSENEALYPQFVKAGLIEPRPVTYIESGFVRVPVHKLGANIIMEIEEKLPADVLDWVITDPTEARKGR